MIQKPGNCELPGAISKKLFHLELLTTILAILSIFLLITLLFISHIINLNPTGPLLPSEQNPYAFAAINLLNDTEITQKVGRISIYPDTKSTMTPSAYIKGFVTGLKPGTSHGLLILENTNFLLDKGEKEDHLFHFNPAGSLSHNCKKDSNINSNSEGHMGDLGNIIADEHGQATIDKYITGFNVNLIYGRVIAILKNKDNCDIENFYLQKNEILSFGILGIYSEDYEQIELKKLLIEKKKKNMFKFKEKSISNEIQVDNDLKNEKQEEKIQKTFISKNILNQSKDELSKNPSIKTSEENQINKKKMALVETNNEASSIPTKQNENLKLESRMEKTNSAEKNGFDNFIDTQKKESNISSADGITKEVQISHSPPENDIKNKKLELKSNAEENKIPDEYLKKLKERRKSLFKTKPSLLIEPKNNESTAKPSKMNSIFEKLSNLIESTAIEKKPNTENNLTENPSIFMGIDLGSNLKENHKNNEELHHFRNQFEKGVDEELHSKLKNLEEKI